MTPTPAPWTVTVWDQQTVYVYGGPENGAIADFSFADEVLQDSYISKEEAIANATLCAGAPDLLEALKGVLRVADRKTAEFDAARAAISKATTVAP
jgi:hypothetical protein